MSTEIVALNNQQQFVVFVNWYAFFFRKSFIFNVNYTTRVNIMIADKKRIFEDRMQALLEKYCQQLPGKYQEIEESWKNYQKDFSNADSIETFYRLIHTFKGTAATFGFVTQSDLCYQIQLILLDIKNNHDILKQSDIPVIQHHLNELKQNINAPAQDIL